MDESLIAHEQNQQVWLRRAIDSSSKIVRLDIIPERNSHNLKKFVINHIIPRTHLIHNNYAGYNFLMDVDSVWTYEPHIKGHGDFWYVLQSTSHIEQK